MVQLEYREPGSGTVAWSRLGHFTLGSEKDGWVVLVRGSRTRLALPALAPAAPLRAAPSLG